MFNHKVYLALAALLMASLIVETVSAADSAPTCEDCIGQSLVELADKYAEKRDCWFNSEHHFVLKLQIWNFIALNDSFKAAHDINNKLVEAKCKTELTLKVCDLLDFDRASECEMENLKTNVENYRDQEMCHGKILQSEAMRIAVKLLSGSFAGWGQIHPDC